MQWRQKLGAEKRAEINRKNAQRSTGPKTPEGQAKSSRNSFKHGAYSEQLVLSSEDAAALNELRADLRAQHQPANETERILVNELAEKFWRIRRAGLFEVNAPEDRAKLKALAAVQRMMSSAERGSTDPSPPSANCGKNARRMGSFHKTRPPCPQRRPGAPNAVSGLEISMAPFRKTRIPANGNQFRPSNGRDAN
jgi:hypothetical protein